MAAVHVKVAAVAVDGRVAVFSQLRQGGDVQQMHGFGHSPENSVENHFPRMRTSRVVAGVVGRRLRLSPAVAAARLSPITCTNLHT
ncbi:unnamed protein product [Linum trigynum]|uniref:Uncharacterized protein n=1 Tax=Linum trigynum TaxID=586398 RepID=A0AAV2C9F6_9ROSI